MILGLIQTWETLEVWVWVLQAYASYSSMRSYDVVQDSNGWAARLRKVDNMMNDMRFLVIIHNGLPVDRDIACYNMIIRVYHDLEKMKSDSN